MAYAGSTIERIGSIAVVISIPLFLISVILLVFDFISAYKHGFMAIIGGFTVFCLGVTLPLYASLVGGYPRIGFDMLSPVISIVAAIFSIIVSVWGDFPLALLLLLTSMASAVAFSFSQLVKSKPRSPQRYVLIYPYIVGFLAPVYGYVWNSLWGFFILYSVGFASPLVGVVGFFYLSRSYSSRRPMLGLLGLLFNVTYVATYIIVNTAGIDDRLWLAMPFILASTSFLIVSISLGFWSGFRSSADQVRYMAKGHSIQFAGILLSFIYALNIYYTDSHVDWIIYYIHSLLIGHALVGIYTQAIMLSPLIIASTWKRRRLSIAPHILALGAVITRPFYPEISGFLVVASIVYMLALMRPSIKRILYILIFGTERGYLLAYKDGVKSKRLKSIN